MRHKPAFSLAFIAPALLCCLGPNVYDLWAVKNVWKSIGDVLLGSKMRGYTLIIVLIMKIVKIY